MIRLEIYRGDRARPVFLPSVMTRLNHRFVQNWSRIIRSRFNDTRHVSSSREGPRSRQLNNHSNNIAHFIEGTDIIYIKSTEIHLWQIGTTDGDGSGRPGPRKISLNTSGRITERVSIFQRRRRTSTTIEVSASGQRFKLKIRDKNGESPATGTSSGASTRGAVAPPRPARSPSRQ